MDNSANNLAKHLIRILSKEGWDNTQTSIIPRFLYLAELEKRKIYSKGLIKEKIIVGSIEPKISVVEWYKINPKKIKDWVPYIKPFPIKSIDYQILEYTVKKYAFCKYFPYGKNYVNGPSSQGLLTIVRESTAFQIALNLYGEFSDMTPILDKVHTSIEPCRYLITVSNIGDLKPKVQKVIADEYSPKDAVESFLKMEYGYKKICIKELLNTKIQIFNLSRMEEEECLI